MLDLSDLMTDPDFASRMILERTEIARREFGRPVYETKQIEITGVIHPASAEDLQPLADGANGYVTEGLVLYTDFVVTGGTNGIRADRIVFEGVCYDVMQVEDWMPNGAYCRAILTRSHDEHEPISGCG